MVNESNLEDLKKKLYRLHFLLTEKENEATINESLKQFSSCFSATMIELSIYLSNEYRINIKNNQEIVESAFTHKLFNKNMTEELKIMISESEKLIDGENSAETYKNIKESYAGYLQMIHDMLARMGQDAEEE
jgi:uncharacterized membrane protein YgaE (UPF0421/DUF939 family)